MLARTRSALVTALAVFLVLTGAGAGHAFWSASATSTATVASGGVAVAQTGFDQVLFQFAAGILTESNLITITNTGTVTSTYTAVLSAPTSTLATAIKVETWVAGANCTATQGTVTSRTWSSGTTLTGTLPAGGAAGYCVRTSMTSANVTANNGSAITAQLAFSAVVTGTTWTTGTSVATAVQSVKDTVSPTRPGTPTFSWTNGYSTVLSWTAATDATGVTGYQILRGGVVVGTSTSLRYTDTGLAPGTTYSYTVRAYDSGGNLSSLSKAGSVTTLPIDSGLWYKIVNPNSGRCLDASGASTVSGTPLVIWTCSGATNQAWKFVQTGDGNYQMVARYQPAFSWEISTSVGGGLQTTNKAQVSTYAGATNQQWNVTAIAAGSYLFTNAASSLCLDVPGASTVNGVQLQQNTCSSGAGQTFTVTSVP